MRITYHAAMSLDGLIAKPDGDVAWLDQLGINPEAAGLATFFASVDGLVMGRASYDFIVNHGTWPYEDKPAWVCTSSDYEPLPGMTALPGRTVEAVMDEARDRKMSHLWLLGGGKLARAFLDLGHLTHIELAVMPILLGDGIPLFAPGTKPVRLIPQKSDAKAGGFAMLRYEVMP